MKIHDRLMRNIHRRRIKGLKDPKILYLGREEFLAFAREMSSELNYIPAEDYFKGRVTFWGISIRISKKERCFRFKA